MKRSITLRPGPELTIYRESGYDLDLTMVKSSLSCSSVSTANSREADWDEKTFHYMWELAKSVPEAGIHVQSQSYPNDLRAQLINCMDV